MVAVRVTTRAGRDAVGAVDDAGALHIRVAAPPADGAANRSVVTLVAKAVGVPRSAVAIASGATARHKRLRIAGVSRQAVLARWPGLSVRVP